MTSGPRNYVMAPHTPFINHEEIKGAMCCENGQCNRYECSEWVDDVLYFPELVREEKRGFAVCPKCGYSYGKYAMTGVEYNKQQGIK